MEYILVPCLFPSTRSSTPPLTFIFFLPNSNFLAPLPCYDINIYLSSSLIYYLAMHRSNFYYANIYKVAKRSDGRCLARDHPCLSLKNQPFCWWADVATHATSTRGGGRRDRINNATFLLSCAARIHLLPQTLLDCSIPFTGTGSTSICALLSSLLWLLLHDVGSLCSHRIRRWRRGVIPCSHKHACHVAAVRCVDGLEADDTREDLLLGVFCSLGVVWEQRHVL